VRRWCTDTIQFSLPILHQKNLSVYNIAAVCCNSQVQKNMFSSNRFTSRQGKTISWYLGLQNLGCHCKILGRHFDTQKRLTKNTATIIPYQDFLHGQILFHLDNPDPDERKTISNPIQIQKIQISGRIALQNPDPVNHCCVLGSFIFPNWQSFVWKYFRMRAVH